MPKLDEILEGLILPGEGSLPAELVQFVLRLRFSDAQAAQFELLSEKNQLGQLSGSEREELEAFVTANTLLMILKSKARRSMAERPSAA